MKKLLLVAAFGAIASVSSVKSMTSPEQPETPFLQTPPPVTRLPMPPLRPAAYISEEAEAAAARDIALAGHKLLTVCTESLDQLIHLPNLTNERSRDDRNAINERISKSIQEYIEALEKGVKTKKLCGALRSIRGTRLMNMSPTFEVLPKTIELIIKLFESNPRPNQASFSRLTFER